MKKIILTGLLFIGTLFFTQCIQSTNLKKMKIFNKELVFPDITSEFENLTSPHLKKELQKRELSESKAQVLNKPKEETEVSVEYNEYDAKKDYSVSYSFDKKENIFAYVIYRKIEPDANKNLENSLYFSESKAYYPNGNIKSKGLIFGGNLGYATVLKDFEFDENGNLIKQFDISKVFNLSLIDVLRILEKNKLTINFNRTSSSAGGVSYDSFIWYKETNHGKVWIVNAILDNFQAIIYDKNGKIIIKKDVPSQKSFLFMEQWQFDDIYKGKTIEEVEKETGLKLFVYQ